MLWSLAAVDTSLGDSGGGQGGLAQVTMSVLTEELQQEMPAYSLEVLERIAVATGEDVSAVRRGLEALLDTLDGHRTGKTEVWQRLLALAGGQPVDRLLQNLIAAGRRMLASGDSYILSLSVEYAGRKAWVAPGEAGAFVLKALKSGMSDREERGERRTVGIIVSGRTERYTQNRAELFLFFDSDDEAFVLEQVREIHRFIVPKVVRRLIDSPRIQWAVRLRNRNELLEPDYDLMVAVDQLRFTGTNTNLRPCVEVTVRLSEAEGGPLVWARELEHCTIAHSADELEGTYDEVADRIYEMVDGYLSGEGK